MDSENAEEFVLAIRDMSDILEKATLYLLDIANLLRYRAIQFDAQQKSDGNVAAFWTSSNSFTCADSEINIAGIDDFVPAQCLPMSLRNKGLTFRNIAESEDALQFGSSRKTPAQVLAILASHRNQRVSEVANAAIIYRREARRG